MQTITIDIINKKVISLLQDLELLQLIRLRKEKTSASAPTNWAVKYKGAMTKQSLTNIDNQLNELRNGWE
jgi:prophage DNA circulation protein